MLKSTLFVLIFSFFIATIIGPFFIPFLHRLKFGQAIREEGPQSHRKKSGTPTMGGIIFITSIVVILLVTVFFTKYATMSNELMMLLLTLVGFGAIGFVDDFIIVVRKNNEGLKPKQKLLAQLVLAAVFFYLFLKSGYSTELSFFNLFNINLYWVYGLFILFWMVGFSNAVNLTDGLDGLASTVSVLVLTFFGVLTFIIKDYSLTIFSVALIAGLIGFLKFNAYPAKVFMGDTGSLAIGGAITTIAIISGYPLLIVIVGGIYVVEALSVIIQVTSFKLTGKRVFKMAPIHHHFEQCGWNEVKIVTVFSIITVVLCIIGFFAI